MNEGYRQHLVDYKVVQLPYSSMGDEVWNGFHVVQSIWR
jgi:hypothetical protein